MKLLFATFEHTPEGGVSTFNDGAQWGARPHETPHYYYLAYRYGHAGDILAYCRANELCHHLIGEAFGTYSLTLHALAHGEEPGAMVSAAEEALAHTLHRYVMTGEPAFIEGIDWSTLDARFWELTHYEN